MPFYNTPLKDMLFILNDYLNISQYQDVPVVNNLSQDLAEPIIHEAGRMFSEVLLPLNQIGDSEGCSLKNGKVTLPKGYQEAYEAFTQAGWTGLNCKTEHGGQDMPLVIGSMVSEIASSCNMAFAMYPGLSHGAYSAISAHGSDIQKKLYLAKLASGEWTGTMNLTEPHAGTDLGLIQTKAEFVTGNRYRITGQKIFISAGEHNLSKNIVHLVLARIAGAPAGVKGISLFIVPKFLPNSSGDTGRKNHISCSKLEEKMGIHANSTCVMNFDAAFGNLIGEPHAGLKYMFTMMNEARLGVGIQGLSQSEIAYQNAVAYAKERLQGRSLSGIKHHDKNADHIIYHPDIRRILMNMRCFNEGSRAFLADIGLQIDLSHHHPDAEVRKKADAFVGLVTPVAKGYITDKAFDMTVQAQQVFGGHGYIREWGMEQFVRDSRIAMIYEGTNGVQALDLVGRKLPKDNGKAVIAYIDEINKFLSQNKDNQQANMIIKGLNVCNEALQQSCMWLMKNASNDPEQVGAVSTTVMHIFGITALCYSWAKMAIIASEKLKANPENASFYQAKIISAHYFADHFVPEVHGLLRKVTVGKKSMMELSALMF